jgi:gamma-glutamylcyclotransferase (GGCT)/AIG2-like uncharacterized protein YtfP
MTVDNCIINTESTLIKNEAVLRTLPKFKEALKIALYESRHTPDINYIESKRGHLLFVYGTLKKGMSRHWMLEQYKARFVATATTFMRYSLYYSPKLGFPVMMPGLVKTPAGNVCGQLYIVPPKVILELDEIEKNTVLYNRMRINTQLLTKPMDNQFQQYATTYAFAYVGWQKEWLPLVNDNRLLPLIPHKNGMLNFIQPTIRPAEPIGYLV